MEQDHLIAVDGLRGMIAAENPAVPADPVKALV